MSKVKVNWNTDIPQEELNLPYVVEIPNLDPEEIADWLSDEYGFLVESFYE